MQAAHGEPRAQLVAFVVGVGLEHSELGGDEQGADVVVGQWPTRVGASGAAHHPEWMGVQEAFVVGPAERGSKHPEPPAGDGETGAGLLPPLKGGSNLLRGERQQADFAERIG